jgi:hypothetical protein
MLAHRRVHTGEKRFMCVMCDKGFNKRMHVESHLKAVHQIADDEVGAITAQCAVATGRTQLPPASMAPTDMHQPQRISASSPIMGVNTELVPLAGLAGMDAAAVDQAALAAAAAANAAHAVPRGNELPHAIVTHVHRAGQMDAAGVGLAPSDAVTVEV